MGGLARQLVCLHDGEKQDIALFLQLRYAGRRGRGQACAPSQKHGGE